MYCIKKITDDLGVGQRFWKSGNTTIKIKCKTDFNIDQTIDVFAVKKDVILNIEERKLAGRLYVWANYPARLKKKKVVFVKVLTAASFRGKNLSTEKDKINQYLRQSLLELDNDTKFVAIDLRSDPKFNFRRRGNGFINATGDIRSSDNSTDLNDYLKTLLRNQEGNKYDSYFKAFYFGDDGYVGNIHVSGYSNFGVDYVVVFKGANDQTAAHEFLHSLNLSHSFSNIESYITAKYTYKYKVTENLMDYSHHDPAHLNDRCALWKWQWEIANS